MISNSNSNSPQDEELDDLVFSYLELRDEGESHESALDQALSARPERELDLRESVDALRATGLLPTDHPGGEHFPERVGGYRLARRLGSGGMGVVFLAHGEQGDPVALKLIRPEQLYFDRARARFQRELNSASLLSHPNIAEVLASGEERGIPFLAQRWVPGSSLDSVLAGVRNENPEGLSGTSLLETLRKKLPPETKEPPDAVAFSGTWEAAVLRIVGQVARALEHAHGRGVLHRDVKPSNIMLTGKGEAVLVDFGLASIPEGESLTRTGAQPGSLPYMSPEQIDGSPRELDERTDIYALGVTLYELLTLRQPYKSRSTERVRAQILESSPLPLRKLNPRISRPTEVLCLKAMDRDPKRRYRNAAEFAEDVERILARRPIVGRPPGAWVQFTRWVKRRPLHAAGLLLAMAIPIAWAGLSQYSLREVQGAYEQERAAKDLLDRHLGMTLQAIRRLFADLSSASIDNTPHLQETRLIAIDLALEVLDELCAERPDDLKVLAERGHLIRKRADYLGGMSRHDEAIRGYEEHMEIYQRLVDEGPAELRLKYLRELSLSTERRAALLLVVDPKGEGFAAYEGALELLRQVAAELPIDSGSHAQLAVALEIYAHALRKAGRVDEAMDVVEEALGIAGEVVSEFPNNPQALQCLANLKSAGLLVRTAARLPRDNLNERKEIIALLRRAIEIAPREREFRSNFVREAARATHLLSDQGRNEEAKALSHEAVETARYLVDSFPSITLYREQLIHALSAHAVTLGRSGDRAAEYEIMREQANIAVEVHLNDPQNRGLRLDAVTMLNNLAVSELFHSRDADRVFATIDRAEAALAPLLEAEPETSSVRELRLALTYTGALMTLLSDDLEDGWERSAEFEELTDLELPKWQVNVADLWAEWITCQGRAGHPESEQTLEARDRAFGALHRALDEGFTNRYRLLASDAFAPALGEDPRWGEFLDRVDEELGESP